MAILFFTNKWFDGSGDIVQTVKVADFVENILRSKGINEDIIIIVPDAEYHRIAVHRFLDNPRIRVQTLSELKSNMPKINCCIEMAYGASFWRADLTEVVQKEEIPCIYMPEYDNDMSPEDSFKILGGFNKEKGCVGVIPSLKLLAATSEDAFLPKEIAEAFEQLDPKIKKYLSPDSPTYLKYCETHDFSYQYSHDTDKYEAWKNNTLAGKEYTPVEFFFREHITLLSQSTHSQDILCFGSSEKIKKAALLKFKDILIQNKYTKIIFINIDTEIEEVLFHDSSLFPSKEYRVLYSTTVPYATMQVLPLLANDFIGVTGDQSLVEAMSAGKLVTYECKGHKKEFAIGYLEAVKKETADTRVLLLAKFLIKTPLRSGCISYDEEQLITLLKDNAIVDALKKINRKLVAESQYFDAVENWIFSQLIKTEPLRYNFFPQNTPKTAKKINAQHKEEKHINCDM